LIPKSSPKKFKFIIVQSVLKKVKEFKVGVTEWVVLYRSLRTNICLLDLSQSESQWELPKPAGERLLLADNRAEVNKICEQFVLFATNNNKKIKAKKRVGSRDRISEDRNRKSKESIAKLFRRSKSRGLG
jgi:hypothetical protein